MRVHHLNCGTMCPLAGGAIGSGTGLRRGLMVCHCLLIETPRDGLVLVDTGWVGGVNYFHPTCCLTTGCYPRTSRGPHRRLGLQWGCWRREHEATRGQTTPLLDPPLERS